MDNIRHHIPVAAWRNPRIWYITAIMMVCIIFYYLAAIVELMGWAKPQWEVLYVVHDLHRLLFFIPVVYAAYIFRVKGVIVTALISMLIFLPRALFISPYSESFLRPIAFVIILGGVGILTSKLLDNISERKRAEQVLRESRDYLERLTNSMWDAVFSVKMPERVIEWANDSFRLIGYDPEECVGRTTEFLYPDKNEFLDFGNKLKNAIAAGKDILNTEQLLKRKSGEVFSAEITTTVYKEEGEVVHVTSIVRDITERRRVEEALRESEERFRALTESTSDWVWEVDVDGVYTYASPKVKELLGYEPGEVIGKTPFDLMPPEEAKRIAEEFRAVVESQRPLARLENTNLHKDGRLVVLETSGVPFFGADGRLCGYRGIDRDITERKRAEERIQQQNEFLEKTLESLAHPFYVVDANDYTVVMANSAARLGKMTKNPKCYTLTHRKSKPCSGPEHPCPLVELKKTKKPVTVEHIHYDKDGNKRNVEVHSHPVFDREGSVIQMIEYCLDITERKKLDQLKDDFIGLVSHELRSPLTVITGAVNTALTEGARLSPEEMRQLLQDAASEAESLSHLLGNLLELSRFQAERLILHAEAIDVKKVVRDAVEEIKRQPSVHEFIVDIPRKLPPVHADPLRLERILYNLLENAVKYSPQGGQVQVSVKPEEEHLVIGISDQGIGISLSDQAKLFGPFQRLEESRPEGVGGVGLGLLVCRRLVEAHGGQIWVESEPGRGSTFFFTMPLSHS